jgi:hypothetical protein
VTPAFASAPAPAPGSYDHWDTINTLLTDELRRRRTDNDPFFTRGGFASMHEQKVHEAVTAAFEGCDVRARLGLAAGVTAGVVSDSFLFNFIECDVVIRIPCGSGGGSGAGSGGGSGSGAGGGSDGDDLLINIEVDGIHHRNGKRARFCHLRDKYLAARGVVVERVMTSFLWDKSAGELQEWVWRVVDREVERRKSGGGSEGSGGGGGGEGQSGGEK